jgi:hypothetical protein
VDRLSDAEVVDGSWSRWMEGESGQLRRGVDVREREREIND